MKKLILLALCFMAINAKAQIFEIKLNKKYIALEAQGCEKSIGGGCNTYSYFILHFKTNKQVVIYNKSVNDCNIKQVKTTITKLDTIGTYSYHINKNKLLIKNFNEFNAGCTINANGTITAIKHSSDYVNKKRIFEFKETENIK